jgi:hypothetical protein
MCSWGPKTPTPARSARGAPSASKAAMTTTPKAAGMSASKLPRSFGPKGVTPVSAKKTPARGASSTAKKTPRTDGTAKRRRRFRPGQKTLKQIRTCERRPVAVAVVCRLQ